MNSTEYDVVIVGSGFSGAILAERLARAGLGVLVLEAGKPRDGRQEHMQRFYKAAAKVPESPWPHAIMADSPGTLDTVFPSWKDGSSNYLHQNGPLPFSSTYERIEGGTGNHWQGLTPRLLPNDFRVGSTFDPAEGAPDWPISYEQLEPWYCDAEHYIGVSGDHSEWADYSDAFRSTEFPMPKIPNSYLDTVVKEKIDGISIDGSDPLKIKSIPQARNSIGRDGRPPCMGNTNCIPICPILAKYDPVIHLDRAMNSTSNPVKVEFQSVAYAVDVCPKTGTVSGVRYRKWDGSEHVAHGKHFVLAANPIETAKILLMSPWTSLNGTECAVGNRSDQVGRNLMDHVILLTWGLMEKEVFGFRGPQATATIGEFRDGKARSERAPWITMLSNTGWGWAANAPYNTVRDLYVRDGLRGSELRKKFKNHINRQISFTCEFEQLPSQYNRVEVSHHHDKLGLPKPEISYTVTPYSRRGFHEAASVMNKVFGRIGDQSTVAFEGMPNSFDFEGKTYQLRGAGHIMGTTRAGHDPETSVVDADLRCHDHTNLSIVGGSVFPTVGTANPTLTICALALRAADNIAEEFGRSLPAVREGLHAIES